MFTIPAVSPFPGFLPNFYAFKLIADKMPMPCVFRDQNNYFPQDLGGPVRTTPARSDGAGLQLHPPVLMGPF